MNREQFESMLRLMGCDDNTVQFGLNAYDIGEEHGTHKSASVGLFSQRGVRETSPMVGLSGEA